VGSDSDGDQDIEDKRCDADGKDKPNDEVIPAAENPNPARPSESKSLGGLGGKGAHLFRKNI